MGIYDIFWTKEKVGVGKEAIGNLISEMRMCDLQVIEEEQTTQKR